MNGRLLQLQNWERAAEDVSRSLCRPAFRQNVDIDAAIQRARDLLQADISDRVNCYSSLDWLFYLRTPSVRRLLYWLNDGFETAHHAEFLTSKSIKTSTDSETRDGGIRPILDNHRFRRIAQLIGASFVWRKLWVLQRVAAMDVPIRVQEGADFPQEFPTNEQRKALKLYDKRIRSRPMFLVSGGAILATTGETDTEATTFVSIGIAEEGFQVGPLGLAKFRQIFDLGIVREEFLQAIGDLLLALKVGYIAARNSGLRDQLDRFGMFCIESRLIGPLLEGAQPLIDPMSDLIPTWSYGSANSYQQRLHHTGSDSGYAPPLRTAGDLSAWDLFAAASLLDDLLFQSLEKRRDERGPLFEDEVQTMIDQTRWRPSVEIRPWKGRSVRVAGKTITNIDALGCRDGRLLLVECKSIYYGFVHGRTSRGEIRNGREKVEEAVRNYSPDALRRADNINACDFSEIIRVVCTPVPVYVEARYATSTATGFPLSISYWELYRLLSETP